MDESERRVELRNLDPRGEVFRFRFLESNTFLSFSDVQQRTKSVRTIFQLERNGRQSGAQILQRRKTVGSAAWNAARIGRDRQKMLAPVCRSPTDHGGHRGNVEGVLRKTDSLIEDGRVINDRDEWKC